MRPVTKSLIGRSCDRRIQLELGGARWRPPPVENQGPPPQYSATHYAVEQIHRAWHRHQEPTPAQLTEFWEQAWRRAHGQGQPPADGFGFLQDYARDDPFGFRDRRQIIGVEIELLIPDLFGFAWSTRPDLICLSPDRAVVEAIELTQASVLRQPHIATALDQLGLSVCLPPRLRELKQRVVYARLPSNWQSEGWYETETTMTAEAADEVLRGIASWLEDVRDSGIASPGLDVCGGCPFAAGVCPESLYWVPPTSEKAGSRR